MGSISILAVVLRSLRNAIRSSKSHRRQSPRCDAFSKVRERKSARTYIEAREMLYIPAFWMHYVYTIKFSVSVNYWWTPPQLAHFISGTEKTLMSSQRLGDALLEIKRLASETAGVSRPELPVFLQNLFADGSMTHLRDRAILTGRI